MNHIVIDARPINTAGYGRYLRGLISNLAVLDKSNRYTLLVWPDFNKEPLELPSNYKTVVANYPITGSLKEQLNLLLKLRKLNPDLVHFGMTQQPALYKGKVITTIHDLTVARTFVGRAPSSRTKQEIYKRLVKRVARKSEYIITPSRYVKHEVAQYANVSPDKIIVTYEAADRIAESALALPRLDGRQFLMYVGRAAPHKNLKRLIDAFIILKEKYPKLMLVLAGKIDANYHGLEAYVTEKRMADSIVFPGFVTEGELKWLYQNTVAYVFPSLSEGFGLPGLEAMAHGAPVVSSNATCLPEVYGEGAIYFDPENTFDMASKISSILSSAGRRGELISKGRTQTTRYSWQKMAKQTLTIYGKVIGD